MTLLLQLYVKSFLNSLSAPDDYTETLISLQYGCFQGAIFFPDFQMISRIDHLLSMLHKN